MASPCVVNIPQLTLGNGLKMPIIGLGTAFSPSDGTSQEEVAGLVKEAIRQGYRLIDTAYIYGTESAVGQAMRESIQDKVLTRQDLFITTKLSTFDLLPECVRPVMEESLSNLGTDYVDLYLIHAPHAYHKDTAGKRSSLNINNDTDYLETWKAMEELVDECKAKSIGLSSFNHQQVQRVLDNCRIKPTVIQIEVHPYHANSRLVSYCQERGITVTGFSPLGQLYSSKMTKVGMTSPLKDPVLKRIGAKHKKTAAQVALRYQTQRSIIVIPRSSNEDEIKENINIFDFELSEEDMRAIAEINRDDRYLLCLPAKEHKDYPFNAPF